MTKAGDAIWVAVTVPNNPTGPWTISVTDSQGNTFKMLNQVNDGPPGTQTVAHFVATNIWGDMTKPDTITVDWPSDNYKGVIIAEVAGASGAAVLGGTAPGQWTALPGRELAMRADGGVGARAAA